MPTAPWLTQNLAQWCRGRSMFKQVFTARCYASAVLAMGLCLSVCLCLCLSQVGVLLKRQNLGSHKQHHTIPQGVQFSVAKDLCEIRPESRPTRAPNASGVVKIGDFRQIAGYISKTVQYRHIVSIKVEQEVLCTLSNGGIARDLECPLTAPNHPIFCILHRHSQLRNG